MDTVGTMGSGGPERTPEGFFDGSPDGLRLYEAVKQAVGDVGEASVRVTKSQIAFRRRKGFLYLWRPGQYVTSDVPAVLSVVLPHEVTSPRIKQVAHPSSTVWMHHIELHQIEEIDDEVRGWLAEAFHNAG